MKNSQIHLNFDNSGIRDFLSILLVKTYEKEFELNKEIIKYNEYPNDCYEWAIKDCENEIKFHSKRLELLKEKQSILTIIKSYGWTTFDVSDETERDLNYKLMINFIGNESEYKILIKTLKSE